MFDLAKSRSTFVEEQRKALTEIAADDIGFVEAKGKEAGFGELQANKELLCAYLDEVLGLITSEEPLINAGLEQAGRQAIQTALSAMQSWRSNAKNYASQQTDQNYHNRRAKLLEGGAQATEQAFRNLAPFEAALRIQNLRTPGDVGEKRAELEQLIAGAKNAEVALRDLQERVRDQVAGLTKDRAAKRFRDLADGHRRSERVWLALLIVLCLVLGGFVWSTVQSPQLHSPAPPVAPADGNADTSGGGQQIGRIVDDAWRRLLLLSVLGVGLRIVLGRYRDERSLRILYDHRATVLTQYEQFDAAIGDDGPAKNQFRLEMSRIVFSDPAAGVHPRGTGGDINISPAISAIEKLGGKSG